MALCKLPRRPTGGGELSCTNASAVNAQIAIQSKTLKRPTEPRISQTRHHDSRASALLQPQDRGIPRLPAALTAGINQVTSAEA